MTSSTTSAYQSGTTSSVLKPGDNLPPLSYPPVSTPVESGKRSLLNVLGWILIAWLAFPWGVYRLFCNKAAIWKKLAFISLGLPLFISTYTLFGIIAFASFLPALDISIGNRPDRTITNSLDHYAVTFLKTGRETGGAYELVQVQLGPHGGNDWHYHTNFVETFTVQQGQLSIGLDGKELTLLPGEQAQAPIRHMHKFYNQTNKSTTFLVKVAPGRGFEKTLRSAYGLMNTGQTGKDGLPKNFWHLCLLLGYSESYMAGMPGFIQEPLVQSLAKIAQWKGEDKALEPFYK